MYLQKLSLLNFKNYSEDDIFFCDKINCFVGNNGVGKTNILDAIHYLSFCKSYFNSIDTQNILHGMDFFLVQGSFLKGEIQDDIYCAQKKNERKQFKINKKEYARFSDHIGLYPLVMISPSDNALISEGSEIRRKYIDSVIAQFDKIYLDDLINYNKALLQRNTLLKYFAEKRKFDQSALEIWNQQLIDLGKKIFEKRNNFIQEFIPLFQSYYSFITGKKEKVNLFYQSQLENNDYITLLDESLEKDRILQYTTTGVHKDDLIFMLDSFPLKKFGSQGQQKSFIISLKLAQFEYTKKMRGFKPILLFDDIFDKLDNSRVEQLMKLVSDNSFGQVFITDAHPERIELIFRDINTEIKIFEIVNGKSKEILHRS
ncbi:MAG TPA: DNA replication/repair protein RecF [Bacteroidales bacterium]|nr:DNA replication/repair protein RecF [Bacteroidales bacterium]HQI46456.1 DNA replication/repair protein RecF [Bacteroidales bacterium]